MTSQTVAKQLESLDRRVILLEQLPARVDNLALQISELRTEMRGEFSAMRGEINTGFACVRAEMRAENESLGATLRAEMKAGNETLARTLRAEMRSGDEALGQTLRAEMNTGFAALREEMKAGSESLGRALREEMRYGNKELRSHMLILHEEVLARFALLDEARANGRSASNRAKSRGKRR
jgi:hypothetical protein